MVRKVFWTIITFLVMLSTVVISCSTDNSSTTTKSEQAITTSSQQVTTSAPTPELSWWEEMWGEPEYGGELVFRASMVDIVTEPQDPRSTQFGSWLEMLWRNNNLIDPATFSFKTTFTPLEYKTGWLLESWERPDPLTVVCHLREGIYWHDKEPTWGREFTAEDIQYSYDRAMAWGEFEGQDPNAYVSTLSVYS